MLDKINNWIDQTLKDYLDQTVSCGQFCSQFNGFYPAKFLSNSSYVIVDKLPKPDFPELRQAGFGNFIDMDVAGITYKNTYFIKKGHENDIALHFHELVHVIQWKHLGAVPFIQRYMEEIKKFGYQNAPLEKMAYELQDHFSKRRQPINIPDYVKSKIYQSHIADTDLFIIHKK
ncbi:MAG: hypothetical protein DSZ06_02090 [Sulfurospirillum sp.]|nr:MAG: hypothetical protein DSZ06_02090 [Sulfurospirillum sp.]